MILTIASPTETLHIEISTDQFAKLRHPNVAIEEINAIAALCGITPKLLSAYVKDLKKSLQDTLEVDGSCDYSDHL